MVSISQAQKTFLNNGGLNDIGSNEAFVPQESASALVQLAALLIENAQQNLDQTAQVSTGALSDSFTTLDPAEQGNVITVQISALNYFDFQNKGVRGVGGGSSGANYSFKSAFPSEAMVSSIEQWLARAGASTSNITKSVSNLESKNKSISSYDNAYAVARAIKIKGIRGTGYFDRAIVTAQGYAADVLGKALAVDIINSLPPNISPPNTSQA